jgi:anti-sigma28 factor (negative regulator of flagellin synthesis)
MTRWCCTKNAGLDSTILVEEEPDDVRVDKVLEIRRQLGEGTYSIEDRLDIVVEKIIEDLGTV